MVTMAEKRQIATEAAERIVKNALLNRPEFSEMVSAIIAEIMTETDGRDDVHRVRLYARWEIEKLFFSIMES